MIHAHQPEHPQCVCVSTLGPLVLGEKGDELELACLVGLLEMCEFNLFNWHEDKCTLVFA